VSAQAESARRICSSIRQFLINSSFVFFSKKDSDISGRKVRRVKVRAVYREYGSGEGYTIIANNGSCWWQWCAKRIICRISEHLGVSLEAHVADQASGNSRDGIKWVRRAFSDVVVGLQASFFFGLPLRACRTAVRIAAWRLIRHLLLTSR